MGDPLALDSGLAPEQGVCGHLPVTGVQPGQLHRPFAQKSFTHALLYCSAGTLYILNNLKQMMERILCPHL